MLRAAVLSWALAGLLSVPAAAQEAEQRRLLDKVRTSVVALRTEEGYGSGLILDEQGTLLTNAHVIVSPLPMRIEVEIKVNDIFRTLQFTRVTLVGVHPTQDLALLKIDPAEHQALLTPLPISRGIVATEDPVHAIGFPVTRKGQKTITSGIVKQPNRIIDGQGYIEFTAEVHHGSSGGPVCDSFGRAVGVVTRGMVSGEPIAWATPLHDFQPELFIPLEQRGRDSARAAAYLKVADDMLKKGESGNTWGTRFAREFFQMALLEDVGSAAPYFKIGMIDRAAGRHATAAAYLARSIQLQPWSESRAKAYQELGSALAQLNRKAEAEVVWNEGLAKYPAEAGAIWDAVAYVFWEAGRFFEAACATRSALRSAGSRIEAMNDLYEQARRRMDAPALMKLQDWERSMDEALELARKDADQAKRSGKNALTPAFETFLRDAIKGQKELSSFNLAALGKRPMPPGEAKIPEADLIPRFIQSRILVASEHMKSGRLDQAREILEDVISTYADRPETENARLFLSALKKK